jgi:hypothetical protein
LKLLLPSFLSATSVLTADLAFAAHFFSQHAVKAYSVAVMWLYSQLPLFSATLNQDQKAFYDLQLFSANRTRSDFAFGCNLLYARSKVIPYGTLT